MSLASFLAAKDGLRAAYAGVVVASHYGHPDAEGQAVAGATALFDLSWRAGLRASGSERAEFLQGQLSNDVASLEPGQGCPCLLLSAQGRLIAILSVFNAGESIMLVTEVATQEVALAALEGFLVADDVELSVETGADRIGLAGPGARDLLARMGFEDEGADLLVSSIDGQVCTVLRHREFGVPVFELLMDDDGQGMWLKLEEAGACPAGTEAWELMRLSSGVARAGVDVGKDRMALEGRLEWAVHRDKGCYVGQEIIERALSRGRLKRQLCLISSDASDGTLEVGAMVEGGSERDVVSSVVVAASGVLAFAYLPIELSLPGTELGLLAAAGNSRATVLEWPAPDPSAGRS